MREWVKALPLGLLLPLAIGAASVKPDDAISNIAEWAKKLGFQNIPEWLANPAVDNRVILGSLGVSALYAFLVWVVPAIRAHQARPKAETNSERLRISIANVIFDPNGPTELYVEFRLSNLGPPSTIKNFSLSATRYGRVVLDKLPPRVAFGQLLVGPMGQLIKGEDLSTKPLESGGERDLRFTFTMQGDAKRELGGSGTRFRLIGFDIRDREVVGEYTVA